MKRGRSTLVRAATALALLGAVLIPTAPVVRAAEPVIGRPAATVRFLQDITFTATATLSGGIKRIEAVVEIEGGRRAIVADVTPDRTQGTLDLRYVLEAPGGGLLPNTDVTVRFRATLEAGTFVDGPSTTIRYEDDRFDWQIRAGDVVTVHWTEGGAAFGQRALGIAENAVREVSALLGVTESKPIDFYVYADRNAFYNILGPASRENVGGQAHPDIRTLFANIAPDVIDDPWVGVVIPHELTHLVFDTAVANPYHYPPRWLNEGLAVYLAEGYVAADRSAVVGAVADGSLLPVTALVGQFPTTADQFYLAYAESVSAVDFLVRTYGEAAMVQLVRSYAQGVTDDEAFQAALATDVAGFETAWLSDLGAATPSPFGPQPDPAGPLPADWVGEGQVPGEVPGGSGSPSAAPGGPARPGSNGGLDVAFILAVLVAVGLAMAGVGAWLRRRTRAAAVVPVASRPGWSEAVPPEAQSPAAEEAEADPADQGDAP